MASETGTIASFANPNAVIGPAVSKAL